MRAQASFEMFLIITILLSFLLPVTFFFFSFQNEHFENIRIEKAYLEVKKIKEAIINTYLNGENSKMVLTVFLPEKTQSLEINNKQIRLNLSGKNANFSIVEPIFVETNKLTVIGSGSKELIIETVKENNVLKCKIYEKFE